MFGKREGNKGDAMLECHSVSSAQRSNLFPAAFLGAVVIVVVSAVYLNSFSGVFLLDDGPHIVDNQHIRRLWPIGEVVAGSHRPVVNLSLAVNYAVSGLNVWSYHAFNLAVHLLAVLTLFGVVRRTLLREPFRQAHFRSAPWLALAVALIWGVHPLQTQSVTYIIQRGESMMGLFYLLTLYCVLRGVDSPRSRWWYAASVVACGLGMGSKAVMVSAPLVVLLYDRVFLARSFSETFRRRLGLYVGLAATWIVLWALGIVRSVLFPPETAAGTVGLSVKGVTALQYALSQPGVILHYLKLSFWPRVLCLDYGWPVAKGMREIVPQAIVVGFLLAGTLWALRVLPWLGFLGAWFFLILSPTSSFVPIQDLAFEHRMYLPLAAVIVLIVVEGCDIATRLLAWRVRGVRLRRAVAWATGVSLVVAIVAGLGYRTAQRNRLYQDAEVLWREAIAENPDNMRAHNNLGLLLASQDKLWEAISHYHQALQIEPTSADAHNNLGIALASQGRRDEAIRHYRQALRIEPRFAPAHYNLGLALAKRGELDEAIAHYREAARIAPHHAETHYRTGEVLSAVGRVDEAIRLYRQALHIEPKFAPAHYNLADALQLRGQVDEAIAHYREAARIAPYRAQTHYRTGEALFAVGRVDESLECFREAARLKPGWPVPLNNLAWILATHPDPDVRDPNEAIRFAERATEIAQRQDASILDTLAAAYAAAGRFGEAVTTAQEALGLASAAGIDELAAVIRQRLERYEQNKPYREPSSASARGAKRP